MSSMFKWWIDKYKHQQEAISYKLPEDIAIEVQNLNSEFGDHKVVTDFNFSFKKNVVYTFLGKSGSGKSTLAAHFNGLIKSNTANIYLFNGHNIYKFHKKIPNYREIRKTVGMVLQNPEYQLFKETVLDDVCCGLKMLRVEDSVPPEEKSKIKLLELGISEDLFTRNPFMLSGGQKKKIALAGILVIEPDIIVFDEPTLGLDPSSSDKIVEVIKGLKEQNKTVIVISNNLDLLLEVGDEMLVLDKGKLIAHGKPYTIFRDKKINLGIPKVVRFIEKLCQENPYFEKLWDYEPRRCEDLAIALSDVLSK